MKKIFQQLAVTLVLINLALTMQMMTASAASIEPPVKEIQNVGTGTGLPDYFSQGGQHADAPPDYLAPGTGTASSPLYFAVDIFRYAMSAIAFIVVIIAAMDLISTATEEEATKAKDSLVMGVMGLILIQLADTIVKKMVFGEQGEAFENVATAELYAEETVSQLRGIIGFIEIFLGAAAVLVIIIRGFVLLTNATEEEELTKAKSHVLYALLGLVIVGISEVVIRGFIFPAAGDKLPDVEVGKKIIIGLTNYASGFVAILAFAILFYAGYQYVVSGGQEEVNEKVKKTVMGAVIGLLVALGAFALVNTFVKLDTPESEQEVPDVNTIPTDELP